MKKVLYIILLGGLLIGCSSNESSSSQPKTNSTIETTAEAEDDNWEPEVYKTSELAELMRKMHEEHFDVKKRIEEGELNLEKKSNYNFIHKATPTDPNDDTPLFHTYADAYLLADSMLYTGTSTKDYKDKFNNMVNSCVACHQNFCMGPINKIELLRIKK